VVKFWQKRAWNYANPFMRENTLGYRRKTVNLHVELVSDVHLQPLVLKPHQPGFVSHLILMGSFDMIFAHIMKTFHPTQMTQRMLVQQNVELQSEAQTQAMRFCQYKGEPAFKLPFLLFYCYLCQKSHISGLYLLRSQGLDLKPIPKMQEYVTRQAK
jgi:hypothetical protein